MDCAMDSPGVVLRFISRVVAMVHPSFQPRARLARSVINRKERGAGRERPRPSILFFHQGSQLLQYPGQLPPQLFIVLFQPVYLLRVQPVGVGVDGYLV